ncbi:MAG: hypothetical protein K2X02_04120 [Alphaproteobacteria bacterium]|nr:hypothetical protein [Alphaproteobacteria bacterium]
MKHRFAFIAVLSLLLSLPFFSFSVFGFAGEDDKEKKVLYFHVGPAKTGTTAIQIECMERREELAKLGVYYPPSQNNMNHEMEFHKLLEDKVEEAKEWILNIKHQSQAYQSILLSTELAAQITRDARFCDFLTFLNQHFRVKYIYCPREIVPAVGSDVTMCIMQGISIGNIEAFIKHLIIDRRYSHDFYSRRDTTFLPYEELTKSGKLVQTFLQQAMGLKIEIPDRSFHSTGNYYTRTTDFTDTQLTDLERAFSVGKGAFSLIYRQPDGILELSKLLSSLIKKRNKEILSNPIFHMGEFCPYLSSGFSDCELSHRWTEGTKASITLPLTEMEPRPSHISFFDTRGLVTKDYTQNLIVKVNGKEDRLYVYTLSNNSQRIDISLSKEDDLAKIEFEIPHAISPYDLGISPDKRKLGISFREVHLQY